MKSDDWIRTRTSRSPSTPLLDSFSLWIIQLFFCRCLFQSGVGHAWPHIQHPFWVDSMHETSQGNISISSYTKLRGLSPRANYTERATAACWRSLYQLLPGSKKYAFRLVSWSAYYYILKMVTCSFETSADFQRTTRRYIPEDRTLRSH
jgi:hypothetical protein